MADSVLIGDVNGRVRIWDWQADAMVFDQTVVGWPWGLGFAPDMSTFSVASYDKVAYIFETATGKLLYEIPHEDEVLWTLEHLPHGCYMTTSDQRGVVHFWDVKTGQEARRFLHLHNSVSFWSTFTPDGRFLLLGTNEGLISFWDLKARPVQIEIPGAGHTEGKVAFTSDGGELFSQGRVFDSRTADPGPETGTIGGSALSLDGRTAFVISPDPFEFRVFDAQSWATVGPTRDLHGRALCVRLVAGRARSSPWPVLLRLIRSACMTAQAARY